MKESFTCFKKFK